MNPEKKMRVLLEMRPALDGYAGIPQETRLLFCGLCALDTVDVEGLLQTSLKFLTSGMTSTRFANDMSTENVRLDRYSLVVLSVSAKPPTTYSGKIKIYLKRRWTALILAISSILPGVRKIPTTLFETRYFENFIWQSLFEKTLPVTDFFLVTTKNYRVCSVPWNSLQTAGLYTRKLKSTLVYPTLDTQGVDIFISQTPYPARFDRETTLVVRYHDALPIFMPHAFANQSRHQAAHFHALKSNVSSGAYFACVSEATRQDLLRLFPEVEDRAVTIHNMVSHHYFEENSPVKLVPQIILSRLNLSSPNTHPPFRSLAEQHCFYEKLSDVSQLNYLLMVSTIEPRKNHRRLISAWEQICAKSDPSLKLVIVGNLGWDTEPILRDMRHGIDKGEIYLLNNVAADDLRVLYRHSVATICPSIAEGFDFSGVEAMRSGGIVLASDIPVHREIYEDASLYFEPHSTASLVNCLELALYSSNSDQIKENLKLVGAEVSKRYLPEKILPQWSVFLNLIKNHEK